MSVLAAVLAAGPSPAPFVTSTPAIPAVSDTGVGLLGFLIVCALLVVCVGLFFAMRSSLRRLRDHEIGGSFGEPTSGAPSATGSPNRPPN